MNYKTKIGIKINFLKVTEMVNTAVLQIGTSGPIKPISSLPEGYQIHPKISPTTQALSPAVPLQAPVREKGSMNK
ncbi:spore germination protein GerPB [Bacillus salipaludis]|uniref:spore germination protein GerPB n=1 Tax=Bacillus salipaludis TaxID=2547811 RepID=UPI003D1A9C60